MPKHFITLMTIRGSFVWRSYEAFSQSIFQSTLLLHLRFLNKDGSMRSGKDDCLLRLNQESTRMGKNFPVKLFNSQLCHGGDMRQNIVMLKNYLFLTAPLRLDCCGYSLELFTIKFSRDCLIYSQRFVMYKHQLVLIKRITKFWIDELRLSHAVIAAFWRLTQAFVFRIYTQLYHSMNKGLISPLLYNEDDE